MSRPSQRPGRKRSFCSSVPKRRIGIDPVQRCALMEKRRPRSGQAYPSASMTAIVVVRSEPAPPYCSGMGSPRIPMSAHFCQPSRQNELAWSRSIMSSRSSFCANRRISLLSASASVERPKSTWSPPFACARSGNWYHQGSHVANAILVCRATRTAPKSVTVPRRSRRRGRPPGADGALDRGYPERWPGRECGRGGSRIAEGCTSAYIDHLEPGLVEKHPLTVNHGQPSLVVFDGGESAD